MIFFIIAFTVLIAWWTQEILGEKPKKEEEKKKTSAQKLGEALGEYLNDGIKIRVEMIEKDKT